MADIQYDPSCVDCRRDASKDVAGTTWQCNGHVRAERDWLRARMALVVVEAEHGKEVITKERNAALTLAEQRGAAYDMTWREVESLRERLDKEEEERGRQYGLRVQAETEVAEGHHTLRRCAVPEQIPPFKTPLAPLAARIFYLREKRDAAVAEVDRLTGLVQGWYEGRARIGAHMTFVDQRFYDSVRCERTGWPGDDADGDGGPPEE